MKRLRTMSEILSDRTFFTEEQHRIESNALNEAIKTGAVNEQERVVSLKTVLF